MTTTQPIAKEYPPWVETCSIPAETAVQSAADFARHVEDYRVDWRSLQFEPDSRGILRLAMPNPKYTHQAVPPRLYFRPTSAFWQSFVRIVNGYTDVSHLSGSSMDTLFGMSEGGNWKVQPDDKTPALEKLPQGFRMMTNGLLDAIDKIYRTRNGERKRILLRTVNSGKEKRWCSEPIARAILHDGYREDISHGWLLEILHKLTFSGKLLRWHFDGNLMKGGWVFPESAKMDNTSSYVGGLYFAHGEIGNRRCALWPFVYRKYNDSLTLLLRHRLKDGTQERAEWSVTHSSGRDRKGLYRDLADFVHTQTPLVSTAVEQVIRSKETLVPEDVNVQQVLLALGTGFPENFLRSWCQHVLDERDLFGLPLSVFTLQGGLGRSARALDDQAQQVKYELYSGELLGMLWEKIFARARTITHEQREKVFE